MHADNDPLVPVYVTRKTADGVIATWSIGAKRGAQLMIATQVALMFVLANVIAWGAFALYLLATLVF
jgi:hypothetical protein